MNDKFQSGRPVEMFGLSLESRFDGMICVNFFFLNIENIGTYLIAIRIKCRGISTKRVILQHNTVRFSVQLNRDL